jgi:RNA polymerase sigma-70 factor (ECF subfamily)
VLAAIDQLPKQCRAIFCLSRFELLTYNEISERLNISVNTVKTQMNRALESLKKKLEKYLLNASMRKVK